MSDMRKVYKYYFTVTSVPFNAQKWDLTGKENGKIKRSLTLKAKVTLVVAMLLVSLIITVLVVCFLVTSSPDSGDYWLPDFHSDSELGNFSQAAVSTDGAPCAAIGKNVLWKGGTAVDAAVAVVICMGAVNPQSSGIGGGLFMLFYDRASQSTTFIDGREVAPAKSSVDMFGGDRWKATEGGLSIAVPGEIAALSYAHQNYGKLPWKELILPTVELCREGLEVNIHLAKNLEKYKDEIMKYPGIRNVFVNNATGEVYQLGDYYTRFDLAQTLETIAEEGLQAFYGPSKLADQILADLKAVGSIIDQYDMMSYTPVVRRPIKIPLKGNNTVFTVSPPGGGAVLALILGILDGYEEMNRNVSKSESATVLALHRIVESFKFGYAQRMEMEDSDSPEMLELIRNMTSRQFADREREKIDDNETHHDPSYYGAKTYFQPDHGTASMVIVAPNGDAVAVTTTVNIFFGSRMLSPSTGILFNDEMDDFSSPNITNWFGIPPTNKNHVVPGRRPMSSMTPAIVTDSNGDVILATSGNGGTQITTSIAQAIIRNIWFEDDIKRTIDSPRLHHQLLPDFIEIEENFPQELLRQLENVGHKSKRLDKMIGILVGIARKNGRLYANSDYRKGGKVDGF